MPKPKPPIVVANAVEIHVPLMDVQTADRGQLIQPVVLKLDALSESARDEIVTLARKAAAER